MALPAPALIGLTGLALQIDVPLRIVATDGVRTTLRRVASVGRLLEVVAGGDACLIGLGFESGQLQRAIGSSTDGGAICVLGNVDIVSV